MIVCEGFLGNVVLKLVEGLAEVVVDLAGTARRENWRWKLGFFMLADSFGLLRDLTDYAVYGGAPILGFEHLTRISHQPSTATANRTASQAVLALRSCDIVLNYASSLIATCGPICRTLGAFVTRPGKKCGLGRGWRR